jgi:hypothetical protein
LYDTKIGIIYYYAIPNTIESKITCLEYYLKNVVKSSTGGRLPKKATKHENHTKVINGIK